MRRGGYTRGYTDADLPRLLASTRQEREASHPQPVVTDHDDPPRTEVVRNCVQVGQDDRGDIRGPATGGAAKKDDGGALVARSRASRAPKSVSAEITVRPSSRARWSTTASVATCKP